MLPSQYFPNERVELTPARFFHVTCLVGCSRRGNRVPRELSYHRQSKTTARLLPVGLHVCSSLACL
jgi:hypothetical protein